MEKLGMTYQRSERRPEGEEVFYAVSREEFLGPRGPDKKSREPKGAEE
jgi:hypothetical protein